MPDRQSKLLRNVLVSLDTAGALDHLVLVGSWCLLAYRDYFKGTGGPRTLRTRDLDFLVPLPSSLRKAINVPDILSQLGFVPGRRGEAGFMILQHPELLVEFLVPERGRGWTGAYELPQLGVNAQPLRFMDIPLMNTLLARLQGVRIRIPHPAAFALHKLLVAGRRREIERRNRDVDTAIELLGLLLPHGDGEVTRQLWEQFPKTWRHAIRRELARVDQFDPLDRLLVSDTRRRRT